MNKTIAKKLLIIPAVFGFMALATGCGTASASALSTYTGDAVVKSHSVSGKKCNANVETSDGKIGSVKIGAKSTCTGLKDGTIVKLENGKYKGKV